MSKFLVRLAVFAGICTQGFAAEQNFDLQSLKFQKLCTVLEESQNEQKIILDKISQRLDADQSALDTQLDKITERLDVDQSTLDSSEPKVVVSKLNKSVEIHKLQDEIYDKLKENSELRLEILKRENQNLKEQLSRLKSPQNQTQVKNYTMMDIVLKGSVLLGIGATAITIVFIGYKIYEQEGGKAFRFKVNY